MQTLATSLSELSDKLKSHYVDISSQPSSVLVELLAQTQSFTRAIEEVSEKMTPKESKEPEVHVDALIGQLEQVLLTLERDPSTRTAAKTQLRDIRT